MRATSPQACLVPWWTRTYGVASKWRACRRPARSPPAGETQQYSSPRLAFLQEHRVYLSSPRLSPKSQVTSHKSQVTSHKSQVTSHKSQVTSHKSRTRLSLRQASINRWSMLERGVIRCMDSRLLLAGRVWWTLEMRLSMDWWHGPRFNEMKLLPVRASTIRYSQLAIRI
jgi:hypothetical protein